MMVAVFERDQILPALLFKARKKVLSNDSGSNRADAPFQAGRPPALPGMSRIRAISCPRPVADSLEISSGDSDDP